MKYTIIALALLFVGGCAKQEKSAEKIGTAMSASYDEVIGPDDGYIIENAALAGEDEDVVHTIANTCKLARGTSSVLIVHTKKDGAGTILALPFPTFADGSELEFTGEPGSGTFFVYGTAGTDVIEEETGLVSGSLRFNKTEESDISLGLNRSVMEGLGEMEIVVSGIKDYGLDIPQEKKYAAQYELPIITLDELVKLNTVL